MITQSRYDRRSFGKLVGALAAAGLAPVALAETAKAGSGSTAPRAARRAGTALGSAGAVGTDSDEPVAGFRPAVRTRLDVLEADAGLPAIPQGLDKFRTWTEKREERMEGLRHVNPGGDLTSPWRGVTANRVKTLDGFLPNPLRCRFLTHLPLDTAGSDFGPVIRQRIADGSCNGVFLYGNAGTPLGPSLIMDSITGSGPPFPIIMSPKNVSDAGQLQAWVDYWRARPEWIPYVRVAFWQEFQGDFGGPGQPPISDWHAGVNTLADAADQIGMASMAHAETWNLHPSQPTGGIPRLLEFLQPVIGRIGGGISWSLFVFNEKPGAGNDYIAWLKAFMSEYFPYTSFGVTAYGDSVPFSLPMDDPRRVARADRVASTLADLLSCNATSGGYYALPQGPDQTRNFWDDLVEAKVARALAGV